MLLFVQFIGWNSVNLRILTGLCHSLHSFQMNPVLQGFPLVAAKVDAAPLPPLRASSLIYWALRNAVKCREPFFSRKCFMCVVNWGNSPEFTSLLDYCDDSRERGSHSDACDVGGIRTGYLTSRDCEKGASTAFRYSGAWHKRYAEERCENPANHGVVDLTSPAHSFIHSPIHLCIRTLIKSFIHTLIRSFYL